MPDDTRALQAESTEAWEANAAYWDEYMGDGNDWHLGLVWPATSRLLGLRPGQHALDVGCGNGLSCRRLAAGGVRVTGIDVSTAMIERARARETDHDALIDYAVIDATDEASLLSLGEARFDAAFSNMVLMDIADVGPLFHALPRLLKPGAPFVFSVGHPAFNSTYVSHLAEQVETPAGFQTEHSLRIRNYLEERTERVSALRGQPRPQPSFHRPIGALLRPAFEAGLVLDGFEEPAFGPEREGRYAGTPGIPPVLVVRLRAPGPR